MVVNKEPNPIDNIRETLKKQNGYLLTSDLSKQGIPRIYLSILEKKGDIQRISRGIYASPNTLVDEMAILQVRYKGALFSHETALYLHGLTDRSPLFYSVTVPSGYNATSLKASGVKVYFVHRDLFPLGLVTLKSPNGNDIKSFDLERTVCDLLRSRNHIDVQFFNQALKKYAVDKTRNIDRLYSYARQFRIQKLIRTYLEVLL